MGDNPVNQVGLAASRAGSRAVGDTPDVIPGLATSQAESAVPASVARAANAAVPTNPADSSATIVACATPRATGALAVIRLSGPASHAIARQVAGGLGRPREARLVTLHDTQGEPVDQALQLVFYAPSSYTGENLVEWHCHGSQAVVNQLLVLACVLGAQPAGPGEFTRRAFLNGKLDLCQAEAVAELINATSRRTARLARRALEGGMREALAPLEQSINWCRAQLEAQLDFSDEDISPAEAEQLRHRLARAGELATSLTGRARANLGQTHTPQVLLLGQPNVGKSSLFNALLGSQRALVNHKPGTTRDLLRESLDCGDVSMCLCDSAGLRDSNDDIEMAGVELALQQLGQAELALVVYDARQPPPLELIDWLTSHCATAGQEPPRLALLANKIDLTDQPGWQELLEHHEHNLLPQQQPTTAATPKCLKHHGHSLPLLRVSASSGAGLDELRDWLVQHCLPPEPESDAFMAGKRQLDALGRVQPLLAQAQQLLDTSPELAAEQLARARTQLGELIGQQHNEQLLDAIFSQFCIGK